MSLNSIPKNPATHTVCPHCNDHRVELDGRAARWYCNNCGRFTSFLEMEAAAQRRSETSRPLIEEEDWDVSEPDS